MKKVLIALLMVAVLLSLCACTVASGSFMSKAQVNSLVKKYGEPKAELTLNYTTGGTNVEVKITYKLLLEQAPIAVTRFIQIAQDEEAGYNETRIDTYNTTYNYMIMGRYRQTDGKYYDMRAGNVNFAGEFASNDYRKPKAGYAEFKMFSLAMYHEEGGENFDTANGTLILALANKTLNSDNYTVFAEFESLTRRIGDAEPTQHSKVPNDILANLKGFTQRASKNVYEYGNESAGFKSISIMQSEVKLTVKILGDIDGSKLPTIR